jgi:hypothetical protein
MGCSGDLDRQNGQRETLRNESLNKLIRKNAGRAWKVWERRGCAVPFLNLGDDRGHLVREDALVAASIHGGRHVVVGLSSHHRRVGEGLHRD